MNVLCLAPHCDDETLGCGGTLARHARNGDRVTVAVVTGPGEGEHPLAPRSAWEVVRAEAAEAMALLGVQELDFGNVPAALVGDVPKHVLNRAVHALVERHRPEVLYVPHPFDLHRDHREIFHAASVAWRPAHELGRGIREVLAYEVLSETHWNAAGIEGAFAPTVWVDISDTIELKLQALEKYRSQMRTFPHARSVEAARHQALWRGAQMGMEAAEAFVLVRRISPRRKAS